MISFNLHKFPGDEIRRLVTESIIPYVTEKYSGYQQKKKMAAAKKNDDKVQVDVEVCYIFL